MKNCHVTKKASISTATGIIYIGMYNDGDANSLQHIFSQEPTKIEKHIPSVGSMHGLIPEGPCTPASYCMP